jgi:hypothetical protein
MDANENISLTQQSERLQKCMKESVEMLGISHGKASQGPQLKIALKKNPAFGMEPPRLAPHAER